MILVPQGAEHRAVCRGLQQAGLASTTMPTVIPIPMGGEPVQQFLAKRLLTDSASWAGSSVLVMGLCGSLRPAHRVGDGVIYERAQTLVNGEVKSWQCGAHLSERLQSRLPQPLPRVKAWTSKQFVHLAPAKRQLAQTYQVDVVDMEATAILEVLATTGSEITMLRVVSDDCDRNLPDLSTVLSSVGILLPGPLAMTMLRNPIRTFRLFRGSLIGLRALQQVTARLFTE